MWSCENVLEDVVVIVKVTDCVRGLVSDSVADGVCDRGADGDSEGVPVRRAVGLSVGECD